MTQKDINRFCMTMPDATELVPQSASLREGGDLFLLDIGDPVKIYELVKK